MTEGPSLGRREGQCISFTINPRGICSHCPEGSMGKKPTLGLGLGRDVKAYAVILILKR